MHHGRASGSVKLHSWIAALGQQGAEAEPWRLGVLELTRPQARRPLAACFHLPILVRVRGSLLEAHALVDHLCLTERGTPVRGIILSQWCLGSDRLEAPVRVTAHRGK